MKRNFYLSMLLILISSVVKAEYPSHFNGIYTDVDNYQEIAVKTFRKGVKIKGIKYRQPHQWVKFVKRNRNTFEDCNGNRIKLRDRRSGIQIHYISRRGFTRVFHQGVRSPYFSNNCSSVTYHIDNKPINRRNWYNYQDDYNSADGYDHHRSDIHHSDLNDHFSLEGTYKTLNGRKIAILDTRQGFKAKFSGDRNWKNYKKINNRFEDQDGNYYIIVGQDELHWFGKFSGKKISIIKISDDVEY